MTSTLVMITNNYPFLADHREVMFVRPEIGPLKRRFDRVIIAPCDTTGPNVDPDSGCEIDTTLTKLLGRGSRDLLRHIPLAIKSSSRSIYFSELATAFIRYGPKGLLRAVSWSRRAAVASYWATSRFNTDDAIVFYTYWKYRNNKGGFGSSKERTKLVGGHENARL